MDDGEFALLRSTECCSLPLFFTIIVRSRSVFVVGIALGYEELVHLGNLHPPATSVFSTSWHLPTLQGANTSLSTCQSS